MLAILPEDQPLNLKINDSQCSPRLAQLLNPPLVKIENSHSPLPKATNLHQGEYDLSPKKLDFTIDEDQNVEDSPNTEPAQDQQIYERLLEVNSEQAPEENIIFEKRRLPLFYKHWSTGAVNNAALNSKNLRTRQRHQVQQIKQKLKTLDLAKEKSKLRNKLSPGLIKWNLLKHVLKSIMLLQHQSAVIINESLSDHINSDFFNSCSDIFIRLNHVDTQLNPVLINAQSNILESKQVRLSEDLRSYHETIASGSFSENQKETYSKVGDFLQPPNMIEFESEQETAKDPEFEPSVLQPSPKPVKMRPVFQGLAKKRKSDKLFKLIGEGNKQNFNQIEKIIQQDPSSNLYEVSDNKHILNKKNDNNLTPLYLACQSGNLEIVKFLISMGANPTVPSLLSEKEQQTPLEVAARWNFIPVVAFLLNIHKFSKKELSTASACCLNKSIRHILKKKMEQRSKKGCFCI